MKFLSRPSVGEWAFFALLAFLCGMLTWWQYRGTGEVARAEMIQLRKTLEDRGGLLARAFDLELMDSCFRLIPEARELEQRDWKTVFEERIGKGIAENRRPIFSRVALSVFEEGGQRLYGVDLKTGRLSPMGWPAEWEPIPAREDHPRGHPAGPWSPLEPAPPNFPDKKGFSPGMPPLDDIGPGRRRSHPGGRILQSDSDGTVFQIPVFSGPDFQGRGWMIFELDLAYLGRTWMPELTGKYLDADGRHSEYVRVKTGGSPGKIIYAQEGNLAQMAKEPPVIVPFNRHAPSLEGGAWLLEIRRRSGLLDNSIAASRLRNFVIAIGLNGLLFAAGVLLIRHAQQARQLAEEQIHFVANVSHELYTPLTVIRGAAYNLQRGIVQEPARVETYTGLILKHAEQLTEMVEQVLELARRSQPCLHLKPVDVTSILNGAIARAEPDTQASQCEVQLRIASPAPVVMGDEPALRRVFRNLISNAAKHAGAGKWIGISAETVDNNGNRFVEIVVTDRGPGIPKSEQQSLFKPFFRGADAKARQIRGSGLGLSLVRETVEAHGGSVSVTSKAGCGSAFNIHLPAAILKKDESQNSPC